MTGEVLPLKIKRNFSYKKNKNAIQLDQGGWGRRGHRESGKGVKEREGGGKGREARGWDLG